MNRIPAGLSALLLGITLASARAADVAVTDPAESGGIPKGLDSVTFPAAIVALAYAATKATPTVRHVVELDPHTRRTLERAARIAAGRDVTDHGDDTA